MGAGSGANVFQPLGGHRATAAAGSAGPALAVDLVGRRVTLAQGELTPVVVTSGTVVLNGLRLVARQGGFGFAASAPDYNLYAVAAGVERYAQRDISDVYAVLYPDPLAVEVDDSHIAALHVPDTAVATTLAFEWQATDTTPELFAQHLLVELWVRTVDDSLVSPTASSDNVVQTFPVEKIAA